MNQHEEELQRKFEVGELPDHEGMDAKAYEAVFSALKSQPEYQLPAGFAARVAARASAKEQRTVSRDYLWLAAGIIVLLASCIVTLIVMEVRLDFSFLQAVADYKGLILFGAGIVAALNWIDRKLVKDHLQQSWR